MQIFHRCNVICTCLRTFVYFLKNLNCWPLVLSQHSADLGDSSIYFLFELAQVNLVVAGES